MKCKVELVFSGADDLLPMLKCKSQAETAEDAMNGVRTVYEAFGAAYDLYVSVAPEVGEQRDDPFDRIIHIGFTCFRFAAVKEGQPKRVWHINQVPKAATLVR